MGASGPCVDLPHWYAGETPAYHAVAFVLEQMVTFNATRSKYKGTDAGNAEKGRL